VAAPALQAQKTVVQQTDMPPGMGKAARKNFKRHQNRKKKSKWGEGSNMQVIDN
jgi:hypothetical protein